MDSDALGRIEGTAAVAKPEVEPRRQARRRAAPPLWFSSGWPTCSNSRTGSAVAELGDAGVASLVAPVQEQAAVGREVRVEGDAEQARSAPTSTRRGRSGLGPSPLLTEAERDDPAARGPTAPRDRRARTDPGRAVEAGRDALDVEVVGAAGCCGGRRGSMASSGSLSEPIAIAAGGRRAAAAATKRRRRRIGARI